MIGLFLPERFGNYFLLSKNVVGIQITKEAIYVVYMTIKGTTRTVNKFIEQPIEQQGNEEAIISALKAVKAQIESIDEVRCALSSSLVIFKEITMPFIGRKKIELAIPFEVEPLLPFNLEQGLIDSIVTNEADNQTSLLVAAIKKEIRDRYVGYFLDAGFQLDCLTVDMFELYGLYQEQHKKKTTSILLDVGIASSHMALLTDGILTYIRSFPQGTQSPKGLAEKVILTAETTLTKHQPGATLEKVILSGAITDGIADQFNYPVEFFTPTELQGITANVAIPAHAMVSLATAWCPQLTDEFTLLQEQAAAKEQQRITRQLIAMGTIIGTIFLSFTLYSFFRVRTLRVAYTAGEKEAIAELQRNFTLKGTQTQSLMAANKAARAELDKQETAWRRISPHNRYAYLNYLAELTKCIDKKESRLQLESIIIKDDTIKLYGSVPEYHNLPKLQKQLNCRPFLGVPKLQDTNFKTEPITLTIQQEEL